MRGQEAMLLLFQTGAAGNATDAAGGQTAGLIGAVLVVAGVLAMALWLDLLFSRVSSLAYGHYRTEGRRCFWTGFVNVAGGLFLALVLMATKVLAILGIALVIGMAFVAVLGLAAAFRHLGMRLLRRELGADEGPWPLLAGGIVAELAFLVPILGQILLLGALVRGFGAAVLGILGARRERKEARLVAVGEAERT